MAKSTNYQKELKKELGPPPKNLVAEKQRLGLEKKSEKKSLSKDPSRKEVGQNKS